MPKNNKNNKSYTKEFKKSVLKRLEPPTNDTVSSLAKELNIPKTTLYGWVRKSDKSITKHKSVNKWTSQDKFQAVLETSTLTETELAEYCRRKGIYLENIKSWKEQCLRANTILSDDPKKLKESLKEEKSKTKNLEKELRIKEKALAETAALLVLRKKANAIWGDQEEE